MSGLLECLTGALKAPGNRTQFYFLKKRESQLLYKLVFPCLWTCVGLCSKEKGLVEKKRSYIFIFKCLIKFNCLVLIRHFCMQMTMWKLVLISRGIIESCSQERQAATTQILKQGIYRSRCI